MSQQFAIVEISSCLGEKETSPGLLFDDDDGRISAKTGIKILHRSAQSAFDLALEAVGRLDSLAAWKAQIKYVLYVTQSPSYFLPNHASRIQAACDLPLSSMCFDINQGCSGYVQALTTLLALQSKGPGAGLIVCADTYSQHLDKDDRSTQVLFSDGATATPIAPTGGLALVGVSHLTDGSGADLLNKPVAQEERLKMDGAAVFHWTRNALGRQIAALLEEHGLVDSDIDHFVLHQASQLVIDNVIKSLGISPHKVPTTLPLTGNLVSSSIPFLLQNNMDVLVGEKNIVVAGFGVGLSSTACLIKAA